MKKELENKIIESAPTLFREYTHENNLNLPIDRYGFQCGNGWFDLILELVNNLESLVKNWSEEGTEIPRILQIKEKFGRLRCYLTHNNKEMLNLIIEAEVKSGFICENCGKIGKIINYRGWIYTLCPDCTEALNKKSLDME